MTGAVANEHKSVPTWIRKEVIEQRDQISFRLRFTDFIIWGLRAALPDFSASRVLPY